ncbi:MAG: substrate-binding domain-containing protein [Solirubrobacterales bacterium]
MGESLTSRRLGVRLLIVAFLLAALCVFVAACGGSSSSSSSEGSSGSEGNGGSESVSASEGEEESGSSEESGLVYFMAPNTQPERYIHQDGPDFAKAMKELDPNIEVKQEVADGTSAAQQSQVETAIANGAKALVVVAADPPSSAGLLEYAASNEVPVVGYENVPLNGPLTSQVIFSPLSAGEQQAKYFSEQVKEGKLGPTPVPIVRLYGNKGDVYEVQMKKGQDKYMEPLIKEGAVEVTCENYVKEWAPENAQTDMEACLSKNPDIRGYLGMYDGDVAGSLAALKQHGLDGKKVKMFGGQNPELSGLQNLLLEEQQDEVYKPYPVEAKAAAELALAAVQGEEPPASLINAQVNNGADTIPTYEIPTIYGHLEEGVDPAGLAEKAVTYGMFTWEEICTGEAAQTKGCKENG